MSLSLFSNVFPPHTPDFLKVPCPFFFEVLFGSDANLVSATSTDFYPYPIFSIIVFFLWLSSIVCIAFSALHVFRKLKAWPFVLHLAVCPSVDVNNMHLTEMSSQLFFFLSRFLRDFVKCV